MSSKRIPSVPSFQESLQNSFVKTPVDSVNQRVLGRVEITKGSAAVNARNLESKEILSDYASTPQFMRIPRQFLGMRWWLGLAFAGVAGFTAVAVVIVFNARAEHAIRAHAQEFAVGNAVAASEALKNDGDLAKLRSDAAEIAARRNLALFVFDRNGRLLTPAKSEGINWLSVPGREDALRAPLAKGRYISGRADGSEFVVGARVYGGQGRVVVAYSRRPELQEQLSVVRGEFLQSAVPAFVGGAALGLLIATLIARRLARIARAAKAIGEGDFTAQTNSRFPDEVGSLALSIDGMGIQLHELFDRLAHERDRLESLLDRLSEGVLLIDGDLNVEFANGRARELLGVGDRLDHLELVNERMTRKLRRFAADLFTARLASQIRLGEDGRTLLVSGIPPAASGENAIIVVVDETERERNERVQREFATNAAHELRTPLASIVTAVEMLQTGAKDEPAARDEFLDVIARESDRLTRLSRALLVLARADARDEQPRLTQVAVAPVLEDVAASLPHRDGVEIGVDCPPAARDRRRRRPARAGALEPGVERGPVHGGRERDHARPGRERLGRDRGRRHRQRHSRARARADLRTFLQSRRAGRGIWSRTGNCA